MNQKLLKVKVRLFHLLLRIAAPVYSLFIDRYINQILIKFHDYNLVILGVLIKKSADFAQVYWFSFKYSAAQVVLKFTLFKRL